MTAAKALAIVGLSALLAAPPAGVSQTPGRTLRIGILDDASETARAHRWQVFRARLRELGYIEGKNLAIEARYARRANERLPALATELVALKPDIIVTAATPPSLAVIKATSSIPIVFTGVADPVATGLVASFGRPGGNATGLSIITPELGTKWIELLRELVPGAKRVAYLTDTGSEGGVLVFTRMRDEARKLDVTVEMFGGQQPKELERSFEAIARERFAGLIVGASARLSDHRLQIVQFAAQHKLPTIYAQREYADAGGLLSYAPDLDSMYRRAAEYVHRIAQGAKPADMPVERPSTIRMVLNLKTSRALGIPIPSSIRHRADELID
jgi:putative tryptophan/tyrosine transport system substrate-binding protein